MTIQELKAHCEKQVEMCEFWAIGKGEKPSGKVYEEHKLILELIEQEPYINKSCISSGVCEHDKNKAMDKVRAEIMNWQTDIHDNEYDAESHDFVFERIYEIIDEVQGRRGNRE